MNRRLAILAGACVLAAAAPALAQDGSLADNLPRFMGRLHPMVVHFPIALLLAGLLFEVWAVAIRRERTKPSPAGMACVLLGAAGAGFAAWFGWINADLETHGAGVADTMEVHRWLGIATAVLAGLAALGAVLGAVSKARPVTAAYRVALVLAAGLVGLAGHWGGTLVYGEGYLTEALFPEPDLPEEIVPVPEIALTGGAFTVDFATQIAPIFADHCIDCHGPSKRKGNLRLDARRYAFDARDADAQVIVPGDAEDSELFLRIDLPHDDDDVMPPEEEGNPLSPEEVEIIRAWIDEGAVWTDAPIVLDPAPIAAGVAEQPPQAFVFDESAREAQGAALARLSERGAVAMPVAAGEPWVEVRFDLLGSGVTDADLALLQGLERMLVSLNLAGTSVTDAGLATLAAFTSLEQLHLERTAVTDAGMAALRPLTRLSYLNLYGTALTDNGLVEIARLPALQRLYVWQTAVSPQAGALLDALKPELMVNTGAELAPVAFDDPPAETEPAPEPEAVPAAPAAEAEPRVGVIDVALLPGCCKAAVEKGGECDHPCCVEARAAGKICEKCSG